MAENESNGTGSETGSVSGEVRRAGSTRKGRIIIVNAADTAAILGKSAPTSSTSSATSSRIPRAREAKRGTFAVEDTRNNDSQTNVSSAPVGSKHTPAPRSYPKSKVTYPTFEAAKNTADFVVSAVEICGVTAIGPQGEMTAFERGVISPPLARIIARTPLAVVDKVSPIFDSAVLVIGLGMYCSRAFGGFMPKKRPVNNGVQEDIRAPQAAPVTQTVSNVRAGDLDGVAVPVPSVISQHMNGNI